MIRLPVPPSANKLFANVRRSPLQVIQGARYPRGRVKTAAYKSWLHEAGWRLKMQRPKAFDGPVSVSIFLPLSSGMDLDNAIKPTLDLLVAHQVIPDDRKQFVRRVVAEWAEGPETDMGVIVMATSAPLAARVQAAGEVA